MEKIEPGKIVSLIYDLYAIDENGKQKLMHQVDPEDPEKIIFGVTEGVIIPLEKALEGKTKGDEFNVVANPNEAFGDYNPEAVMELEKDLFVRDGKFDTEIVKIGQYVPMMTADGYRINGLVLALTDDKVKMDFNHPLAGKIVRLKGSVLDVREATEQELHIAKGACGCGCHGGCSESDGCGCDNSQSGCGCDSNGGGCGCH